MKSKLINRLSITLLLSLLSVITFAQSPSIALSTGKVSASAELGSTTTQTFTISNSGNRDLNWSLNRQQYGAEVTFIKQDYADWTLEENQDRFTENVILTRKDNQGFFNIAQEEAASNSSPADTEWAFGDTEDLSPSDYNVWKNTVNSDPSSMINQSMSMHAISEDRYFNMYVTGFSGSNTGGGFSYYRIETVAPDAIRYIPATFSAESGTIPVGGSTEITVTFDTDYLIAGKFQGFLLINSNDPVTSSITVPMELLVTGGVADLYCNNTLNFEDGYVGITSTAVITIENDGTGYLNISNITSDNSVFVPQVTNVSIAPDDSYTLSVDFAPTAIQAYTGTLTITSNDPNSPYFVTLNAEALDVPIISLNSNTLSQTVASGSTASQAFTISNNGNSDLTYSFDLNLGKSEPVTFTKEDYADASVLPNHDWISPTFQLARDNYEGLYNIYDQSYFNGNGPSDSEWASTSTELATSYTTWKTAWNNLSSNGGVYYSPGHTSSLHILSEDRYFDVHILQWTGNGEGGGFSYTREEVYNWIKPTPSTGTITAGESEEITVEFDPTGLPIGTYSGMLNVESNDPNNPTMSIAVSITVTGSPVASIDDELNFDDTIIGNSNTQSFAILNEGAAPLNITNITSDNAAIVPATTSITVPGYSYSTVEVSFNPSVVQEYTGVITGTTNDLANPSFAIVYAAEGLAPGNLDLTLPTLSVSLQTGNTETKTIQLANTGAGNLNWTLDMINENPVVSFAKENYADWTLESNQDRIADNVWITRAEEQGLFNAATERSFNSSNSPLGTGWAEGSTFSVNDSDYDNWRDAVNSNPPSSVGNTYSLKVGRDYYDLTFTSWTRGDGIGGGGFSYERKKAAGWIKVDDSDGNISSGSTSDIKLTFDPKSYPAGTYNEILILTSDIPNQPAIQIPIELTVTGLPAISVSTDEVAFGEVGVGLSKTVTITIQNEGTETLSIASILSDHADITADVSSAEIAPDESLNVQVTLTPSTVQSYTATLTISSNDSDEPSIVVDMTGSGVEIPNMTVSVNEINVESTTESIFTGSFEIGNTGNVDLNWSFNSANLNSILGVLNDGYEDITDLIPNIYTFEYDGGSNYINDGGDDMYDNGNYLNTSMASEIPYSDNVVVDGSSYFGTGTTYFTRHLDGLFVMVADINGIDEFNITGNLGADGGGSIDATVLESTINGITYNGYVTRVYDANDPSINHIIIVEKNAYTSQTYDAGTGVEDHVITGLSKTSRIHYLLYAGANGTYIDDTHATSIMEQYISTISLDEFTHEWITLDPNTGGTIASEGSTTVNYTIDITGFAPSIYNANITIASNDPAHSPYNIPVTVNTGGIKVINPIADQIINKGFGSMVLDISNVFSDLNNDVLTYTIGNSNKGIVTTSLVGTDLTINEVKPGKAILTIRADDGHGNVVFEDFEFHIVNVNAIENQFVNTGFGSSSIDLSMLFSDSGFGDQISLSVVSSNEAVVTTTISGMSLDIIEVGVGTSTITITANDGTNDIIATSFDFTVKLAPVVVGLPDLVKAIGFNTFVINLVDNFTNANDDVLTYTAVSSNTTVATVTVSESGSMTVTEVGAGTTTITVTVDNGSGSVSDEFLLTIGQVLSTDLSAMGLEVYPNPVHDRLNLFNKTGHSMQIQVISSLGEVIYTDTITPGVQQLDMSKNASGLYFVRLQSNGFKKVMKLIVQ
ncbi:choice-of-anchor D domain-containing protein [Reichenbachiella agarivorans]|uniref:Choice-of-anchor D domain-containing protein n=1 Tax=Reichenbachiella agarivorans TaxID=2979464 RepID=A0ABY6CTT1_9BACT|nr:choice-of-anchor D domain-containing protein [Reichenbachiella agarivorans]UXP32788.1 choice-of-anchor D domain-containing protein [Reichenbachiella agarivorans]